MAETGRKRVACKLSKLRQRTRNNMVCVILKVIGEERRVINFHLAKI